MRKTIVVLGGGIDSLGILRRLKQMGIYTIVVDGDKNAPARRHLADHFVDVSCYDSWHVCRHFALQTAHIFDGVLGGGTDTPDVIADLLHLRGMRGLKSRTAEISKNKWMQKKIFQEAGIRIPEWVAGDTPKLLDKVAKIELISKPVRNRGSRGIMRIRPGDPIKRAVEYSAEFDEQGHTILEQWVDGTQLSSESLVQDGKIIYTAFSERNYGRLRETYPYVVEDGGNMPPSILPFYENDYTEKADAELQKCVDAMGLGSGTLKGDLVWDGYNIWVIEVATRLSGGSFCSEQIPEVWGVDFVGYAAKLAMGERIYPGEIKPFLRRHMAQRFVIPRGTTCHPERGPGFINYGKSYEEATYRAEQEVKQWLGQRKEKQ